MAAVKAVNAQLNAILPWLFLGCHFAVGSVHLALGSVRFVTMLATFCQAQLWTLKHMLSLTALWSCRDRLLVCIRKQIGYNSCNNSSISFISSNNNNSSSSSSNSSPLLTVRHCS